MTARMWCVVAALAAALAFGCEGELPKIYPNECRDMCAPRLVKSFDGVRGTCECEASR